MEPENQQWQPAVGKWYRWRDAAGEEWDAVDIATSQGKKKITFLSRRAPEETTEHLRAVLFSEAKKIVILPLPYNVGGKQEIEVHWYEAIGDEGPFFRLADRWGEYLVDLRRKTTAVMVRRKGVTFAGELRAGEDMIASIGYSDYGTRIEATIAGRPAMVVIGPLATEKGKKIGEIRGR